MRAPGSRAIARTARASCRRGWARLLPRPTNARAALRDVPPRAVRRSLARRFGVRRCRRGLVTVLPAAPARPALLLGPFVGFQHRHALVVARAGEAIPPVGEARELAFEFAALAAQREEIPAGPITRMLDEPERTPARALQETRLQRPDLLDRRFEAARDGELFCLLLEHGVHRREQRRNRRF